MHRTQNQCILNETQSKNGYLKNFWDLGFFLDLGAKIPGILFKSTQTIYKRGKKKFEKMKK
jgi:hypothetical protein